MIIKFTTYVFLMSMFSSIFGESNTELDLRKYLYENYDKNIRPVKNPNDAVNVTVGMTLQQLLEVDEEHGTLRVSAWMNYNWKWKDQFLMWNESVYPISDIRASVKDIWIPDLEVYNNNKKPSTTARDDTNVVVTSRGDMTWIPPYELTTTCKFDMHWFPFDEQYCQIKIGSWTYNGYKLNIKLIENSGGVDLSTYVINEDWALFGAPCERNEVYYECCPEPYQDITCEIKIRRKSTKYWGKYVNAQFLTSFICIMSGFISASLPVPRLMLKFMMIILFLLSIPKNLPETGMFTNFITGNNYLIILSSLIFDAIMITLHSRTKKEDETKRSSKKILMIVDITIAILFMITYFANVIATFVNMPLIK